MRKQAGLWLPYTYHLLCIAIFLVALTGCAENSGPPRITENLSQSSPADKSPSPAASAKLADQGFHGHVYHWRDHALLPEVEVFVDPLADDTEEDTRFGAMTDSSGYYQLAVDTLTPTTLRFNKPLTELESGNVISSADALAALKLAVGINPNIDPDGAGSHAKPPVSPYQFIAADINQDGRVTSADALAILKSAVGSGGSTPRKWVFIAEDHNFWDASLHNGQGGFKTTQDQVVWPVDGIPVSAAEPVVNGVGVLLGDVNGDWRADQNHTRLETSYFTQLRAGLGTLMAQWGLPDELAEPPAIHQFSFLKANNPSLTDDVILAIDDSTISGRVPANVAVNDLIANFEVTANSVTINSAMQSSGVSRNDFTQIVTYTVMNSDGVSMDFDVDVTHFTGLPMIHLSTDNAVPIDSKDDYVTGQVEVDGGREFANLASSQMKIRGRGNSTWGIHPKKPYQMKLEEKATFLGMPEDKKWLFLAEYSDKTLLRNTIAFEMGHRSRLDWTPQSEFAEVYLNGQYNGTYNITQKVEEGNERVDLADVGFLLEIDQLHRLDPDDVYFYTNHFLINVKEPSIEAEDANYFLIRDRILAFETALFSDDFKDEAAGYRPHIDLASFVDWYLISEITKNVDSKDFSSIYLNAMPEGPIKMGPLWDFDLSFGNVDYADSRYAQGFWIKDHPWYQRLFADPSFVSEVNTRFTDFKNDQALILAKVDELAQKLQLAQQQNDGLWQTIGRYVWPNPVVYDTYQEEVDHLKAWYSDRMTWLESALAGLNDPDSNNSGDSTSGNGGNSAQWPQRVAPVDADVESAVSALVAQMTLAEKVGQMVQAEIGAVTPEQARQSHLGSVLNGGGSWPNGKNSSVVDWVSLADRFYAASTDVSDGGVGIPMIWGTDAVHGHNNVVGATIFPHNIGLGAANNAELLYQIGEVTALEVSATGLDWVFAPTLAVVRNDSWGRTYEGFSEDPEIVKAYAAAIVNGLQGGASDRFGSGHVIATAKHFIGDGGTENGTDQGNAVMSEIELRDIHAQGYFSALEAGVETVMASFNSWNGEKLHGHAYLLTDVLKEKMGFDGLVLGDWNGHGQVSGCTDDQCAQAIMAGIDMFMVPFAWQAFIQNTIAQVQNGTIPLARIDDAVTRILRVKKRAGVLDGGKPSSREFAGNNALIGAPAHRAIARQAVRESLVLLKNSGGILPLAADSRVLVAGSGADDIGQQSGGWTLSWQGQDNTNADFPSATSIYAGIQSRVEAAGGSTALSTDGDFSGTAPDVAIVVFGESPYAEGAGDLDTIEYQRGNKADLQVLESLRNRGIPVVSIFLTGRPLWVNSELNASNAFVVAWLPGSEGAGVADVIFKKVDGNINYDFTGRLSYSWPKRSDQLALNRNDSDYDPLFPYGFGLTYDDTDTLSDDLPTAVGGSGETILTRVIPGIIEAEHYAAMSGIQTEGTSDIGGGVNVGYVNTGDWLEYRIDVASAGRYMIEYRLASDVGSSGFSTLVDGVEMDRQTLEDTGGWQSWITQSAMVDLEAGLQTLRIEAVGSDWNMNWMRIFAE